MTKRAHFKNLPQTWLPAPLLGSPTKQAEALPSALRRLMPKIRHPLPYSGLGGELRGGGVAAHPHDAGSGVNCAGRSVHSGHRREVKGRGAMCAGAPTSIGRGAGFSHNQ